MRNCTEKKNMFARVFNPRFSGSGRLIVTLFLSLFLGTVGQSLFADGFNRQLKVGQSFTYKHWNTKRKKITGYTIINYLIDAKEGRRYVLEKSQNQDANRKAFTEKKVWFDERSGELIGYEEEDFRTGRKIVNRLREGTVFTQVVKKNKKLEFLMEIEPDMVLFEVLSLTLRKHVRELIQRGEYRFTLYLPVLAVDLKEEGYPLSLSRFGMEATIEKEYSADTVAGNLSLLQILVRPRSFFIRSVLPKEKTEFRFTFLKESPHYLIEFEENVTRSILTHISN